MERELSASKWSKGGLGWHLPSHFGRRLRYQKACNVESSSHAKTPLEGYHWQLISVDFLGSKQHPKREINLVHQCSFQSVSDVEENPPMSWAVQRLDHHKNRWQCCPLLVVWLLAPSRATNLWPPFSSNYGNLWSGMECKGLKYYQREQLGLSARPPKPFLNMNLHQLPA